MREGVTRLINFYPFLSSFVITNLCAQLQMRSIAFRINHNLSPLTRYVSLIAVTTAFVLPTTQISLPAFRLPGPVAQWVPTPPVG